MHSTDACTKCGALDSVSGPMYRTDWTDGERLEYFCLVCRYTWSKPTLDSKKFFDALDADADI